MAKSVTRLVDDKHQRAFIKLFDAACQRHNRWSVFTDFVHMAAISISNAVDKSHAEAREKDYLRIVKQYDKKELDCFAHMLAEITLGLDAYPDQDFMGELFMNLDLGNKYRGQFFTPYNISRMMAEMLSSKEGLERQIKEQGWIGVNDCACGAGGMLAAFANTCTRYDVNYQRHVLFVGQDVDYTAGFMCYLQLSLLGCPGYVVIANTLSNPTISLDGRGLIPDPTQEIWYTPLYFLPEWHYRRQFAYLERLMNLADDACEINGDNTPETKREPNRAESAPIETPKIKPELNQAEIELNETKTGQLSLF